MPEKIRISIIDFLPEYEKHPIGLDKNGSPIHLGDMIEYNGDKTWFVVYRYGEVLLKQAGLMALIKLKDWSIVERQNIFGAAGDWMIICYKDDPLYEKIKHLFKKINTL